MQQNLFDSSQKKAEAIEEGTKLPHTNTDLDFLRNELYDNGLLTDIDLSLSDFIAVKGEQNTYVLLAIALLSAANRLGHSSLEVNRVNADPSSIYGRPGRAAVNLHGFTISESVLAESALIGNGENTEGNALPLVLENGRLYFNRYFSYEQDIARRLHELSAQQLTYDADAIERCKTWFTRLFDQSDESLYQRVASAAALNRKLTVVTGGPGTGKTYAVLRILVMLLQQNNTQPPRIAVAAPTGKAANRVRESLIEGINNLIASNGNGSIPGLDEIASHIPVQAQTIHRLLGVRYRSASFRHNRENPLPYDIVIVDEASMIDMALMSKLLDALGSSARLILLGDKHQLASVESGAVFADICHEQKLNMSSRNFGAFCSSVGITLQSGTMVNDDEVSVLKDCIVELEHSRRFSAESGIGRLAACINTGDADGAISLLKEGRDDVVWLNARPTEYLKAVKPDLDAQYQIYLSQNNTSGEKLAAMSRFQLLCAHRRGPGGVVEVNELIEKELDVRTDKTSNWYKGRPVIMTKNDYQLNLFNGDTGITLATNTQGNTPDGATTALRVAMEEFDPAEKERSVKLRPVSQLQQMETCWALSVHKSQGSEYDTVLLALPEQDSPVLTRELIYTAVTRSRSKVLVAGTEQLIRKAIQRKTLRFSGLSERLNK